MFTRLAIITISLHLCCGLKHETLTKHHEFPEKTLILSESSVDNTTLFYALCSQPIKQCSVVQEINPFVNSTITRKCEIQLEADNVQLLVGSGKDKSIIISQQSTTLRLTLVHMTNCKVTDAKILDIPENWKDTRMYRKNLEVVVFQDGFEVIIKGLSQLCEIPDQSRYCSFGYDSDGKLIEGPVVWPKTPYIIGNISSAIVPDVSGRWYLFIDQNVTLTGIQMRRSGGPTWIKQWGPIDFNNPNWSVGYSVANGVSGMCYTDNRIVRCWQQNLLIKTSIRKELTIPHKHETWNTYVHNLHGGGFIVMLINCPNRICTGVDDQYYMMKLDDEGNQMGNLEIDFKSDCNANNGDISAGLFENQHGLLCAVRLCKNQMEKTGKLETLVHCYSDDQFETKH